MCSGAATSLVFRGVLLGSGIYMDGAGWAECRVLSVVLYCCGMGDEMGGHWMDQQAMCRSYGGTVYPCILPVLLYVHLYVEYVYRVPYDEDKCRMTACYNSMYGVQQAHRCT